jgi:hypothetical protein
MEVTLYPVSEVYGGNLYYPVDLAKDVFVRYSDWIESAPDELTSSVLIVDYPPIPALPEFLRGKSSVQVRGCYCGPIEQGEGLLQHWRQWREPLERRKVTARVLFLSRSKSIASSTHT